MPTHELRVDRALPAREQGHICHNRWHPDIAPALTCLPGDEVVVETRDAVDGQLSMASTHGDVARLDRTVVHPLTGPIGVDGAEPGDLLVVDIVDISTGSFGYTAQIPGFGFLRDEFPDPFLVRWELAEGWGTSPDLPGIRIRGNPFMGTMGVAPSHGLLLSISTREQELARAGADVALPEPRGAIPDDPQIAAEGLRTKPPRENGGNMDVKQMVAGSTVFFPVWVDGAMFSAGDGHFAQGDGEVCGTAIETETTLRLRFDLQKGAAGAGAFRDVRFFGNRDAAETTGSFVATTGVSTYAGADGEPENLNSAARSAVRNMIDYLNAQFGYTRQQAYAICSVAVDLKVSEIVDAPNFVVTAVLPTAVLGGASEGRQGREGA